MSASAERQVRQPRTGSRAGRLVSIVVVLVVLVAIWEGYKLVWLEMGWIRPVRPDNTTMPHVWDMVIELFRPVRRGGSTRCAKPLSAL